MATYPHNKQLVIQNVQRVKRTQISMLRSIASRDRLMYEEQLQFCIEARKLPWWNIKRYFAVSPDLEYLEDLNRLIKDLECNNIPYSFCQRYLYLKDLIRYHNILVRLDDITRMESLLNTYSVNEVILTEEELQRYMK